MSRLFRCCRRFEDRSKERTLWNCCGVFNSAAGNFLYFLLGRMMTPVLDPVSSDLAVVLVFLAPISQRWCISMCQAV